MVVIVLEGSKALRRCLTALSEQVNAAENEVIVPYDDRHEEVSKLAGTFSSVRFIPLEGEHTYAELRTVGVRAARARIVAVTEDHCIPCRDWGLNLLKAHESTCVAVGGAVEKLIPDSALNWSLYLLDYVRYANPRPQEEVDHLTDCNVSYKRAALDTIRSVWEHEFHEPEVHAALREQGGALLFAPDAFVFQQRNVSIRSAIEDRFAFGRLFGSRRVEGATLFRRLFYTCTSVILPLLLVGRAGGHVVRKRRYTGAFIRSLPFTLLFSTTWALGEFTGYLTGQAATMLTPVLKEKVDVGV